MKRIVIYITAIIILSGCSVQQEVKEVQRSIIVHFIDFQKYEAEGFFISSTPYIGNYKNIGELTIGITPAKGNYKVPTEQNPNWYMIVYKEENIDYNEVLAIAVKEAKAKGADALVNLKITKEISGSDQYTISGLCIKRL